MGTVSVNGFRGIRIEELRVRFASERGPELQLATPLALINISLNDLLYGDLKVERIVLNDSEVTLIRPLESDWYEPARKGIEPALVNIEPAASFRVMGRDCTLRIENVVGESSVYLDAFSFDISQLEEAGQLAATLEGFLSGDPKKQLSLKLTAASNEDFDLRVETSHLTAEDVNVVFPASEDFVESGETDATLWINGRPGGTVVISLHALFNGLTVRGQPDFIDPARGTLTALAYYETDTDVLTLATATADSAQLAGELGGTIDFSQNYPYLDLRLKASKIPSREIINAVFENTDDSYGTFDVALGLEQEVYLDIVGTTESPHMTAVVSAPRGDISFTPADEQLPEVLLQFADLEARWNPSEEEPLALKCSIVDGEVWHDRWDIRVEQVFGAVTLKDGILTADPVKGVINESTFVGTVQYDTMSGDADATFSGSLPRIETTMLADLIRHTRIGGVASVQGRMWKRGDVITVDTQLDATQATIDYQWWFSKPAGVGVGGQVVAELDLNSGVSVYFDCEVASTKLNGDFRILRTDEPERRWVLQEVHATSDKMDINSVAKCLNLPYTFTGGTGSEAFFNWTRIGPGRQFEQRLGMRIDEIVVVPEVPGESYTIRASDVTIEVEMQSEAGTQAYIEIAASQAEIPPIGEQWIVPLVPPPEYPLKDREWAIALAVDELHTGVWKGRRFKGEAYANHSMTGFTKYSAKIGDGYVSGKYDMVKAHNTFTSRIRWQNIPAETMLAHLNYEDLLSGSITGEIEYAMDRDDPSTLKGEGYFDIREGEFNAEFLYSLIRGQVEDDFISLPVSLAFKRLKSKVGLEGDRVTTLDIMLDSEAFKLTGNGSYFRDGDMDYRIDVRIDPKTAREIPLIAEYFNVEGHRIARQDLALGFRITGPTFNPTGTLAELPPASVTLVSGAIEVANEAVRVIDLPRRILLDLVKTGGAIMGS